MYPNMVGTMQLSVSENGELYPNVFEYAKKYSDDK